MSDINRLLMILNNGSDAAVLDNAEEIASELRRQAARIAELEQAAESARAMLRILDRDGFGSIAVGATLLALDKALGVPS